MKFSQQVGNWWRTGAIASWKPAIAGFLSIGLGIGVIPSTGWGQPSTSTLVFQKATAPKPTLQKQPAPQRELTLQEINSLKRFVKEQTETALSLAGVGKAGLPPAYSAAVKTYRAAWAKKDGEVAPFLGAWVSDWDTFPPYYFLSIFPSRVKGQVCLIEWGIQLVDANPVPVEVPIPAVFSTAKIAKGKGIGQAFRFDRRLISRIRSSGAPHEMEFFALLTSKKQRRLYASKEPPTRLSSWPALIQKQFAANGCLPGLPE